MPRRTRSKRATVRRVRGAALALSLVLLGAAALAVGVVLGRTMVGAMLAAARNDTRPAVLEPVGGADPAGTPAAGDAPTGGGQTAGGAASSDPAGPAAARAATVTVRLDAVTWYGVQLGVFSEPDRATEYAAELAERNVIAATAAAGGLTRLYTGIGPDQAAARGVAARLGTAGIDRFVVAFQLHASPVHVTGSDAAVRALAAGWEAWWQALDAHARAWQAAAPGSPTGELPAPPAGGWAAAVREARTQLEAAVDASAAETGQGGPGDLARRLLALAGDLEASATALDAGARDAALTAGYAAFLRAALGYLLTPDLSRSGN